MKVIRVISLVLVILLITACEQPNNTNAKENIVRGIENFILVNEVLNLKHNPNPDNVEEKDLYVYTDFFNYEEKDSNNVELEYEKYYDSFDNLLIINDIIESFDNFEEDKLLRSEIYDAYVIVKFIGEDIYVDYYSKGIELDTLYREQYLLKNMNGKAYMERFSTIYDKVEDEFIQHKRMIVYEEHYVQTIEHLISLDTFTFTYNSYEDQEYFRYKMFYDNDPVFKRETVEFYVEEHNSFVSYDIKDDELEDYRVKYFRDGHRLLKLDVNIFNVKPSETELTWNILGTTGWEDVREFNGEMILFRQNLPIMTDYDFTIQLNGFGKIEAYKMITGDVTNDEITLSKYGLTSGIDLDDLEAARTVFLQTYLDEVSEFGFIVGDLNNYNIIEAIFEDYLSEGIMSEFVTHN